MVKRNYKKEFCERVAQLAITAATVWGLMLMLLI